MVADRGTVNLDFKGLSGKGYIKGEVRFFLHPEANSVSERERGKERRRKRGEKREERGNERE